MAESSSLFDPFGIWSGLAAQLEKRAKELAQQGVNSEQFAQGMNKALGATLAAKKVNKDLMRRWLESLDVPTRADVEALGERLQAIDDRLVAIADALDRLAGPNAAATTLPSPPRTKKPPPRADAPPAAAPTPAAPPARKRIKTR
jgi:hypothetical protein